MARPLFTQQTSINYIFLRGKKHHTHVAGIAAGDGSLSSGLYAGVNPFANVVSVKVLDEGGRGNSGDALAGLQWVLDNAKHYNIRVANLSIGTEDTGNCDPLVRMVEALWDAGIVVVAAAGNTGPDASTVTAPGNSAKIITVGAADDDCEASQGAVANFSGRGPTLECIVKPNILAAGCNIISCLSNSPEMNLQRILKMHLVGKYYVKMTGTSMASPFVAGAASSLLSRFPYLSPDQVKLILKHSAIDINLPPNRQGWGIINTKKFLNGGL